MSTATDHDDLKDVRQVTYKFCPDRNLPDRVDNEPRWFNGGPTNRGIANFEFDEPKQCIETLLFEESPGVYREPDWPGRGVYMPIMVALMHAGILKDFKIPISDVLNVNEKAIETKGSLRMEVHDGFLEVGLRKP